MPVFFFRKNFDRRGWSSDFLRCLQNPSLVQNKLTFEFVVSVAARKFQQQSSILVAVSRRSSTTFLGWLSPEEPRDFDQPYPGELRLESLCPIPRSWILLLAKFCTTETLRQRSSLFRTAVGKEMKLKVIRE